MHKTPTRTKVVLMIILLYACFVNVFFLHSYTTRITFKDAEPVQVPEPAAVKHRPCVAATHAVLVLAPREVTPHTNDPSTAIRVLQPVHRMLRRLARGTVYLAVSMATFTPSHAVWCGRVHSETQGRVTCNLLLADALTVGAALDALRREDPCVSTALTIEDAAAVDGALLERMANLATGHYACLTPVQYKGRCAVYYMPMNNNASYAFMDQL